MGIINEIKRSVIAGEVEVVADLTNLAVEQKEDIHKIFGEGYTAGLDVIGERFTKGEIFLPEMLVAAKAVITGMDILRPLMSMVDLRCAGTIVIGTVIGDVHDIGKGIVSMMSEGAGFRVVDIGVDAPAKKYIDAAITNEADIIAMSALLSTTRRNMEGMIKDIRASELGDRVKIMVGGAPITEDFAYIIGADGYAPDAVGAVKKAKELMGIS